jgi:two-component system, OmpR family, phosphate regulon sensor histidine kinase PhoR
VKKIQLQFKNLSLFRIIMVVILALFLPVLSYTIFQLAQTSSQEALIESIYENQLSSILFSANQESWDTVLDLSAQLQENYSGTQQWEEMALGLDNFVSSQKYILGAIVQSSDNHIYKNTKQVLANLSNSSILKYREGQAAELERMAKQAKQGYLNPVTTPIPFDSLNISFISLPILQNNAAQFKSIGILIDAAQFVIDVTAAHINSLGRGNFDFFIQNKNNKNILVRTTDLEKFYDLDESLWIFPHIKMSITSANESIKTLARQRTRRNFIFLLFVNSMFILGMIYVLRNITKEMRLAKSKSDFVANVSHELRTPLAHIRLYAETLEMGRVPSEEKKMYYYKTIMNESARLTQLLNNILDFSKIEANKQEYYFSPAHLKNIIDEIVELYSFHLKNKGFDFDIESKDVPEISIDRGAVKQAIINLVDNAVKFSAENKSIVIKLAQNANHVIVEISDNGIGIPESAKEHIFEKFYRAESSLIHNTKGTGLGLSLVKHIMDVHKGTVTVKSREGLGSTFSLFFPKI